MPVAVAIYSTLEPAGTSATVSDWVDASARSCVPPSDLVISVWVGGVHSFGTNDTRFASLAAM